MRNLVVVQFYIKPTRRCQLQLLLGIERESTNQSNGLLLLLACQLSKSPKNQQRVIHGHNLAVPGLVHSLNHHCTMSMAHTARVYTMLAVPPIDDSAHLAPPLSLLFCPSSPFHIMPETDRLYIGKKTRSQGECVAFEDQQGITTLPLFFFLVSP